MLSSAMEYGGRITDARTALRRQVARVVKWGGVVFLVVGFIAGPVDAASKPKRIRGTGETISLKAFQAKHGLSKEEMKRRFGAAGRISCPWATATAFLIAQADVFITSDHLFVAPEKKSKDRGRSGKCYLEFFFSKKRYKIKPDTLVHGLRTTKSAHNFYWFDWAIGRLDSPVDGVEPYSVGPETLPTGMDITMISQGINDFVPRVCMGHVSTSHGNTSVNEFTTTCDTGPGASGGPVVAGRADEAGKSQRAAIGLTWGYDEPYWQVIGLAHLAIPIADAEIHKAITELLRETSAIQQ